MRIAQVADNSATPRAASATTPARVIIVEDESHARRYLRELLESDPRIDVVGESSNGISGLRQIESLHPDIAFVDIQMPDLDGFGMIARIGGVEPPLLVFVTGYDDYAVKAFEIEAVDYLCKPFDKDRLAVAIERALRRLNAAPLDGGESEWLTTVQIKQDGQITWLPISEIVWIEAANKYVVIYTTSGSHILRDTIQGLENRLDPREFLRTHRSALVRKGAVKGLCPLPHGDYIVKLTNGAEAPLSRGFRASFFRAMSR